MAASRDGIGFVYCNDKRKRELVSVSNNFQSRKEREKERIVFDCAQRSRDDGHETVSTPLLLPVPLARYHRQRSQPASTRKGRKKEFSPQNSARPRSPQRFDYSTQREQSSRALCRATRTFVIKIPGTGGGDGAFASGGGDGDAGELMGRIRRATREQQTRDEVRRRQRK